VVRPAEADPTPSRLLAIATRAERLAAELAIVQATLRNSGDEPIRRAGWRLDDAAAEVGRVARAITATARALAFIERVRERPHCAAHWGCCPEHGATLAGSGGWCWCTAPGCGRVWKADRMDLPCDEPPAFMVVDTAGKEGLVCAGHAIAARRQLAGGRLLPLQERPAPGEGGSR
jgi:hypothetical protein